MTKRLTSVLTSLSALLLGVLLTFAFAPYEIFPFGALAPACLLGLLLKATPKRAFWLGFLFGLGLFGAGVYWVFISIHSIGEVPALLSGAITASLVAFLALYPALTAYALNRYFPLNNTTKIVCAFPALWVVSEWIRSWLLTGFPWLLLGYSQTNSPLKGYAPILSVYGVSLVTLLTGSLILNAYLELKQKNYKQTYFSLLAFITIWIVGTLLCYIPWTRPVGAPVSVSLVQGNIPQQLKWSPEHLSMSLERYQSLTEPLWTKSKLIIWPEAAVPLPLQNAQDYVNDLNNKAVAAKSHLMLGIPIQTPDMRGYYNAVVSLGSEQRVYLKRRLVPFGEYTPFSSLFANLFQFMNVPMSNLIAGNLQQGPLAIDGLKIQTSICYEIAYPELINSSDRNISLLLTVTNDAWFGKSNAEAQHLQMAAMRAIELGRPALFVSNDGITAIINPQGGIQAAAPQHQTFVLSGTVQPMYGITPWMRNGIDPILFILICLLVTAGVSVRKQSKLPHQQKENTLANTAEK